ncbi:uncharacterized protein LOC125528543, partial [Triticum urartu]|uniref:uncharacterized protein LOC125528543 n=1 Tax=Triticum urartu TaxID=4572 RepID=UPI002043AAD0
MAETEEFLVRSLKVTDMSAHTAARCRHGNLERALQVMERKMRSSGIERLIKRRTEHHVKNSEKRVLARKALMARVRSQELGKSLRDILIKKI